MSVTITYDGSDLLRFADHMRDFAEELPAACARALNRTGDQVATRVGRVLAEETGAHVHDVRDGIEQTPSTADDLTYVLTISGEFMPLSEFDPHWTRQGVSARPWATRRLFPLSLPQIKSARTDGATHQAQAALR